MVDISTPEARKKIHDLAADIADFTSLASSDEADLLKYRIALFHVLIKDPYFRFRDPFRVPKATQGYRVIRPAGSHLKNVHERLAMWLELLPGAMGLDYCYILGRGSHGTVALHKDSRYSAVFDLKDAFNHVRQADIEKWLLYHHPKMRTKEGLNLIHRVTDLMCYRGFAPQGCTTTPFAYNLVIRPLDKWLQAYCRKHDYVYTRYSDNICISAKTRMAFGALDELVNKLVDNIGFQVNQGKTQIFEDSPSLYLGMLFYNGLTVPSVQQQIKMVNFVTRACEGPTPHKLKKKVTGHWVNLYKCCVGKVPVRLFNPFNQYYKRVGHPPRTFRDAQVIKEDITLLWKPH